MAESVKVIDPNSGSGYDYDSLFDWEAAQQADIDTSNTIAVAKCRCTGGTADTTAVEIDGWTTSAADYIKIWTDPAESYRHNGIYPTGNKYRIEVSVYQGVIRCSENHVRIIGLAVHGTPHNWDEVSGIFIGDSGFYGHIIESCIIRSTGTASNGYGNGDGIRSRNITTGSIIIANNIIYGPFGKSIYISMASGSPTGAVYNNTCFGSKGTEGSALHVGINSGTCYFTNNISQDSANQDAIYSFGTTSPLTNISSDTSSPNSAFWSITLTFTNLSAGSEDFHLDSSDTEAIGAGTNLYNDATYAFQADIDGNDRGGAAAAWDIGADEYVSSASIEQKNFRLRNDDDSESAATWKASQDTNITLAADTAFRLRFLLKATGNPDSIDAQAEARVKPSGGAFGAWGKIN